MSKGRGNSSATTTGEALKLNINYLIKKGAIVAGREVKSTVDFSNGSSLELTAHLIKWNEYVLIRYSKNKVNFEFRVFIEEMDSNLGKGLHYYFLCPQTGKRCKILYMAYGSDSFKSRGAYNKRLYYLTQLRSKELRTVARYFHVEKRVDIMYSKRRTQTYQGKETKRHKRLCKLLKLKAELDEKRQDELMQYMDRMGYFDIKA